MYTYKKNYNDIYALAKDGGCIKNAYPDVECSWMEGSTPTLNVETESNIDLSAIGIGKTGWSIAYCDARVVRLSVAERAVLVKEKALMKLKAGTETIESLKKLREIFSPFSESMRIGISAALDEL